MSIFVYRRVREERRALKAIREACIMRYSRGMAWGSSLEDVVKVNAYITDLTRFAEFNEVYREFFTQDQPARTTVATALLGILVEVDCIAQLSDSRDGG